MIETVALLAAGAAIGVALGAVGGGGSLLAVPALVYLGDQSVRSAQAGSLIVVIAASALGVLHYLRRGEVRWRAGLAFGLAAGAASLAASLLSRGIDPDLLLLAFAPVMALGAVAMLTERAALASRFRPWRHGVSARGLAEVLLAGLAVGSLTGLFGVGGGFVIVPVLVLGLGFGIAEATGTSLLVIVVGAAPALAERLGSAAVEWSIVGPFAAAVLAGVLAGTGIGRRASARALTRGFALVVVLTALYTGTRALLALT
ncbi:MAG: sulfite exporter TauE/SafE family protein [Solirubrobacterales bacterium]